MGVIKSAVDTRAEAFKNNAKAMRALVDDLRGVAGKIREGGGKEARERHLKRGKLLPRERVRTLLDVGSPFLELSQLAAHGMYNGDRKSTRLNSSHSAKSRMPSSA